MAVALGPQQIAWDDPWSAHFYESFCERHTRYREANAVLVARAQLAPGLSVLDLAAGSGRTAQAALPLLGPSGRVLCFEPATAMRDAGAARLEDARVGWASCWPEAGARFDRVLCGAALWQLTPLAATFERIRASLAPAGALCFNIPSLYLGEADEAGGGSDPLLLGLPSLLSAGREACAAASESIPNAAEIEALLRAAGFEAWAWTHRSVFTQTAYRDWLKIPVITNGLLPGVGADERARRIDAAFAHVDASSWRWERWTGWTARAK